METEKLRDLMILNKDFLAQLYKSNNAKVNQKHLSLSSNLQLRLVIHILHAVSKGLIPLKKAQFEVLHRARKVKVDNYLPFKFKCNFLF